MRGFKRAASLAVAATAALAGTAIVAGPASAAVNPVALCGGGKYYEIDHHNVTGAVIHLLYNGKTNCVVTVKTDKVGQRTPLSAGVFIEGSKDIHQDVGEFEYYAGPAKVDAAGKCIVWGGGSGRAGKGIEDKYISPASHCG